VEVQLNASCTRWYYERFKGWCFRDSFAGKQFSFSLGISVLSWALLFEQNVRSSIVSEQQLGIIEAAWSMKQAPDEPVSWATDDCTQELAFKRECDRTCLSIQDLQPRAISHYRYPEHYHMLKLGRLLCENTREYG